jgi:CBS domain-containing protein
MRGFLEFTAGDAMTHPVSTVDPDLTVGELEALFERYDYNSFPVVRADHLVGIVTKFDFLRNFIFTPQSILPHYDTLMQRRVREIMREQVTTVAPDTPLTRVLQLMIDLTTKSFPVVTRDGDRDRVVGIISREDVIRALRRSVGRA